MGGGGAGAGNGGGGVNKGDAAYQRSKTMR